MHTRAARNPRTCSSPVGIAGTICGTVTLPMHWALRDREPNSMLFARHAVLENTVLVGQCVQVESQTLNMPPAVR